MNSKVDIKKSKKLLLVKSNTSQIGKNKWEEVNKLLNDSLKKTLSIAEGYKIGRLTIEGNKASVQLDDGDIIEIDESYEVQVLNDNEWLQLTNDMINKKTKEGWPLLAGFDARVKEVRKWKQQQEEKY